MGMERGTQKQPMEEPQHSWGVTEKTLLLKDHFPLFAWWGLAVCRGGYSEPLLFSLLNAYEPLSAGASA